MTRGMLAARPGMLATAPGMAARVLAADAPRTPLSRICLGSPKVSSNGCEISVRTAADTGDVAASHKPIPKLPTPSARVQGSSEFQN